MNPKTLLLVTLLVACGKGGKESGTTTGMATGSTTGSCPVGLVGEALPAALLSVWGTSASDVWAVGADDGTGPLVIHYDGTSWSRVDTGTTGDLWWVWGDSADSVWFSGDGGRVVHHTPSTGVSVETVIADPAIVLFGTWGTAANHIWTVGTRTDGIGQSVAFVYDGTDWTGQTDLPVEAAAGNVFKVWGSSADDVWITGAKKLVASRDGTGTWTVHDIPEAPPLSGNTTFLTVSGCDDEVIAVGGSGNAAVARYDGTTWTADSPPPLDIVPAFTGIDVDCSHGIHAVGNSGSFYSRGAGAAGLWASACEFPLTFLDYHGAWIDPDGGRWAVGGDLTAQTDGIVAYSGPATIADIAL